MKNIIIILASAFLSISAYSQNAGLDVCEECNENCITLEFFGDNTPSDVLLWSTCYYYDPCIDQEFPNPCDPVVGTSLGNLPVINLCLLDSCYTLSINGLQGGTVSSGVNILNGGVLESTVYFFESYEVISFSVFGGTYGNTCPEACVSEVENPCPADLDGDGTINMSDMMVLLGAFGTSCDGFAPPSNKSIEDLIEKSNIKTIQFYNDFVTLKESINYWIISSNGQIIKNDRSNQIDLSTLSNGVYILVTDNESRKFVINR